MADAHGADPRDLAGSACRALVVGTGHHTRGAHLADLPSALHTAGALADALTSACGMPAEHVRLVTDPPSAADILGPLEEAIAQSHGGALVFCFVGHGLLGPAGKLYLATAATVPRKAAALQPGSAAAIAFRPRTRLLAAQTPGRLLVWDTTDPDHPRTVAEHTTGDQTAYSLAFSPDGTALAAGTEHGRLRLWDMTDPHRPRPAYDAAVTARDTAVASVAFTRDGRHLLTGNGNTENHTSGHAEIRLFDVTDPARPRLRDTATTDTVMAVAAHPRRDLAVATGTAGTITWWRIEDGRRLRPIQPEQKSSYPSIWGVVGFDAGIPSLAFRPDGAVLAGADSGDTSPRMLLRKVGQKESALYDSLSELGDRPAGEPVQAVAYSPDGTTIAAGDMGGSVRLWPERPLAPAVPGAISDTDPGTKAVSPDGRYLLTEATTDEDTPLHRVWDLTDPASPRLAFTLPQEWEARYFLPDRKTPVLVSHWWKNGSSEHLFRFWEFTAGRPRHGRDIPFTATDAVTAVAADGRLFAVGAAGSRRLELWDVEDVHHPVRRSVIDAFTDLQHHQPWFLDDHTLFTTESHADRRDLRLWDLTDPRHPRKAGSIPWGADGGGAGYLGPQHVLIVDSPGETLQLWNVRDRDDPVKGRRLHATSMGYYPVARGRLATVLRDGTILFWDISDVDHPRRSETLRLDHAVRSMTVTPDGRHVVTGMSVDGQLFSATEEFRIWATEPDGRWRTPAETSLTGVSDMQVLPGDNSRMAVVGRVDDDRWTFLLGLDSDRIYHDLCRAHPVSVPATQWKTLFPHLAYRPSCD
ncbi:WD40 repeat domain-containing protein [Streptomyces sp. NPDC046881]|uniref:WD40 repeat domain-containing protein n=1 Tax=Streptomyces sp. NPDC046881 TaxID=3155374 RepID=UPI0033F72221